MQERSRYRAALTGSYLCERKDQLSPPEIGTCLPRHRPSRVFHCLERSPFSLGCLLGRRLQFGPKSAVRRRPIERCPGDRRGKHAVHTRSALELHRQSR